MSEPLPKDAVVKMTLKADSGYTAKVDTRIDSDQWGDINRVLSGKLSFAETIPAAPGTRKAFNDLLEAAKHIQAILHHPSKSVSALDGGKLDDAIAAYEKVASVT